jgi:inorganic pyrophosphatase
VATWADKEHVHAVVETPRGSCAKLEFDPKLGAFTLSKHSRFQSSPRRGRIVVKTDSKFFSPCATPGTGILLSNCLPRMIAP